MKKLKTIRPQIYVYALIFILFIGSYIGLILLWHHQQDQTKSLNGQINQLAINQAASQGPTYRDASISPAEKTVYLPLAKLKLPDSKLAENLVYTYTEAYSISGSKKVFPPNLSISTHDLAANAASTTQQFDCTQVVYADFITPSYPVNPMWKPDGSKKLSDGRVMNVYYAPSIPGCQASWHLNKINPKATADLLKQAASY